MDYAKLENGELIPFVGEVADDEAMLADGWRVYTLDRDPYPQGEPSGKYNGRISYVEGVTTIVERVVWELDPYWEEEQEEEVSE